MSRQKIGLFILLIFLAAIQFLKSPRNENSLVLGVDIGATYRMPGSVNKLLQNSCYDCHSNHTEYPWYSNIQPFRWWLALHITKGKAELNFTEFGNYSIRRQQSKLKAIKDALEDDSMPLTSYTLIHTSARLSKSDKQLILNWIENTQHTILKDK